jgi:uncharacterized membrane protein
MVEQLVEFFRGIPDWISLIAISVLPIIELRGGIIAAKLMGVAFLRAFPICIIGNILPIPFVLLLLDKIFALLRKFKFTSKFMAFLDRKVEKNRDKVERYGWLGLLLFVGIPLPGTGAWTGTLIANALKMPIKKSLPTIFLGVICAAIVMSVISYFIPGLFGF